MEMGNEGHWIPAQPVAWEPWYTKLDLGTASSGATSWASPALFFHCPPPHSSFPIWESTHH